MRHEDLSLVAELIKQRDDAREALVTATREADALRERISQLDAFAELERARRRQHAWLVLAQHARQAQQNYIAKHDPSAQEQRMLAQQQPIQNNMLGQQREFGECTCVPGRALAFQALAIR
jgi:hypothetical protein